VEQNFGGPLGTLIAGVGLSAFYVALIWINTLLGVFLTPFFIVPLTWIQDWWLARKKAVQA
jgi:predicted Na+-dependent transporter